MKKKKKKEANDELLEEIQQKSPAERAERSALELPRSSGSKEKKRKRKSSSSDEGESSDSSFQLAALPKGVEKIREMHRRHPGPGIADLAALRGAPRQASGSSAGVLPADLPDGAPSGGDRGPELQGALDDRHAVAENDPLRALVQRLKAIELSHLQGNWTQAEQLELVKTGGGRPCSSKSSKQPSRRSAPTGRSGREREEDAPVGGANVVAGGSDRRGCSRSRGEGGKQGSAGSRAGLALLDGMPEEIGQQRAQIDKHLANVNVAQAYRTIMARAVTGKAQEEAAFNFAGVVIDNIDLPSDTLLEIVGQKFGVLLDEDGPQVSKAFAELFGLGAPAVEGGWARATWCAFAFGTAQWGGGPRVPPWLARVRWGHLRWTRRWWPPLLCVPGGLLRAAGAGTGQGSS